MSKEEKEYILTKINESLSNTYFHEDLEANKNGYKCCIEDLKEILDELN